MNWDELYSRVKKAAEKTADQINYSTDLATLQVKATMAEQKLEKAYTALGKTAYQHFAGEENTAEAVAKAMLRVEDEKRALLALKRRIAALKKQRAAELAVQKKANEEAKKESAPVSTPKKAPVSDQLITPIEPIDPIEIIEPIEPIDPSEVIEPLEPAEPIGSIALTEPIEEAEAIENTQLLSEESTDAPVEDAEEIQAPVTEKQENS